MKSSCLVATFALAISGAAGAAEQPFDDSAIVGVWDLSSCGAGRQLGPDPTKDYGVHFRRWYVFDTAHWIGRYTFYADERCLQPLFDVRWAGSYRLGDAVPGVPGARAGDFGRETVYLTVQTPKLLPKLAGCGQGDWQVGVQQDISRTGCLSLSPGLASSVAYPLDHDIVEVKDGRLTPGFRTLDMGRPEGRPTKLQPPEMAAARRD